MNTVKKIVICFITFSVVSHAETQIGITGAQGWTNHERLLSPLGGGVFVLQSLSKRVRFQFQGDYLEEKQAYVATIYRGWVPMPGDTVVDLFKSKMWSKSFELALLYRVAASGMLRLDIGTGLDLAIFDGRIKGSHSGFAVPVGSSEKFGVGFLFDLQIASPKLRPLVMHFCFRQRYTTADYECSDCSGAFQDAIDISEVRFGLAWLFMTKESPRDD